MSSKVLSKVLLIDNFRGDILNSLCKITAFGMFIQNLNSSILRSNAKMFPFLSLICHFASEVKLVAQGQ